MSYAYTPNDPPGNHPYWQHSTSQKEFFHEQSSLSLTITSNPQTVAFSDSGVSGRLDAWLRQIVADGVTVDGVSKQATDQVWYIVCKINESPVSQGYVTKTQQGTSGLPSGVPVAVVVRDGSTRMVETYDTPLLVTNLNKMQGPLTSLTVEVKNEAGTLATFTKLSLIMCLTKKI